jgi:quinoprotein glucose dehydrogenase
MTTRPPFVLAATGALYALLALVFCAGGAVLLWRDGAAYYLIAGAGLLLCAGLVWRGKRAAQPVSAALLLGTLAWSVWEVQFDWGQLQPRIDVWFVLAAWLLVPSVRRHLGTAESDGAGSHRVGGKLLWAALAVSAGVGLFSVMN